MYLTPNSILSASSGSAPPLVGVNPSWNPKNKEVLPFTSYVAPKPIKLLSELASFLGYPCSVFIALLAASTYLSCVISQSSLLNPKFKVKGPTFTSSFI